MEYYKQLIEEKNLSQLFVFGMYRSGTTAIARLFSSESKIAFSSDPIRPFFNWYRTKLQKILGIKKSRIIQDLWVIILKGILITLKN